MQVKHKSDSEQRAHEKTAKSDMCIMKKVLSRMDKSRKHDLTKNLKGQGKQNEESDKND